MADIFISYSKADRALAVTISTFLEAEGWTVWWDKSLAAGDSYRDEIMSQLAAARAVITLWTENSVRSDWVRAEAGRAKAEGKLIPVKTPALTYADIPLPFGEMHTESTSALDLIRAAVVAQLATQPSTVWLATKAVPLHLLTWTGIVGGAITLFANARDILNLADWVRWFVTSWQDWTHSIWAWVFAWIGLRVPRPFVPMLSFAAFTAMLVVGTRLRDGGRPRGAQSTNVQTTVRSGLWRFCRLLGIYAGYIVVVSVVWMVAWEIANMLGPTAASALTHMGTSLVLGLSLLILLPALYAIYWRVSASRPLYPHCCSCA
jgi:hypothetical protein